jgi:hypothetical protein
MLIWSYALIRRARSLLEVKGGISTSISNPSPHCYRPPMAPHAPVEVWEKILKYSISVPLFFESDPAASYGVECLPRYYDEVGYWRSERIRNRLKRVCRSWESFLRFYDHRYVCLTDILHQRIPVTVVPLAVRLNIETDYECSCWGHCERQVNRSEGMISVLKEAATVGWDESKGQYPMWRTEILDGQLPDEQADFELLIRKVPKLRAAVHCEASTFARLRDYPKTLQFLSIPGSWLLYPLTPTPGLILPHLTTLNLPLDSMEAPCTDWSLPSLRHLSIRYHGPPNWRDILDLSRRLGTNLLTFYLYVRTIMLQETEPPKELWDTIQCVERIEMPFWGSVSPPTSHPARYARISMDTLGEAMESREDKVVNIVPWLPKWWLPSSNSVGEERSRTFHGIMTVQMDMSWLWYLTDDTASPKSLPLWIAEFYRTRGIRFIDNGGVTLFEYVLFMIKCYWKGGLANRRCRAFYRDIFRF